MNDGENGDDVTKDDIWPECECIDRGDPFLAEIVKADDIIDDHIFEAEFLGLEDAAAARVAELVARDRLSYELALLYKWWALELSSGRPGS